VKNDKKRWKTPQNCFQKNKFFTSYFQEEVQIRS
jgi:hypothetical protein